MVLFRIKMSRDWSASKVVCGLPLYLLLFWQNLNCTMTVEALAAYYLKVYAELKENMHGLRKMQPELRANFPAHSAYPGCAFNLRHSTVTDNHTHSGNYLLVLCATSDKGSHLYLEDLNIIVRFSPSYTILFPLHLSATPTFPFKRMRNNIWSHSSIPVASIIGWGVMVHHSYYIMDITRTH